MTPKSKAALPAIAVAVLVGVMSSRAHAAASTTTVPLQLHGTEAAVVVIRVQGKELPLQLDTGDASALVLHPEVLAALHSEPTGETFTGFSMDGKIETPIVRLDHVEIGNLKLSGVAARQDVHDEAFRKYKKTEIGAVGFIGAGVFRSGQILVDYPRTSLTVSLPKTSGAVRNICRGQPIPFIERQWGLMTAVSTDFGELEFGVDTGASAIVMTRAAATSAKVASDQDSTELKNFAIGGRNFGPQHVEIWEMPTPPGMAGLIGQPFFAAHAICFDYRKLAIHIQ